MIGLTRSPLHGDHPSKPDRDIQEDVLAELNRDGRLTPAEVGVEVVGGVVTLTGTVSRRAKIDIAADIAVGVSGVHDVANKLVAADGSSDHDDSAIAHAVRHALRWNTAVPAHQIDTIVRNGVVTLRGGVELRYQREGAEDVVAAVAGVVSVDNRIQVLKVPSSDDDLRGEVEDALGNLPGGKDVEVRVAAGVVTLAGTVGSSAVRRQAEALAAACGVRSVVNQLKPR